MRQFLLTLLIIWPALFYSQDRQIEINGKVTNQKEVEGIHVLNKTSRYNAITGAYGNFMISVKVNDTLIFSSIKYETKEVVVTPGDFERGIILVELQELVNELDEVFIGPDLTGLLKTDIEKIKVKDAKNFQDFGIPGFKGIPQERIVSLPSALFPTSIQLEALYKHITGYYRKLRLRRMWDAQNQLVARIIDHYGIDFFKEAYQVPEDRVYDFILYCTENSSIGADFSRGNHAAVLEVFQKESAEYLSRISSQKE